MYLCMHILRVTFSSRVYLTVVFLYVYILFRYRHIDSSIRKTKFYDKDLKHVFPYSAISKIIN